MEKKIRRPTFLIPCASKFLTSVGAFFFVLSGFQSHCFLLQISTFQNLIRPSHKDTIEITCPDSHEKPLLSSICQKRTNNMPSYFLAQTDH